MNRQQAEHILDAYVDLECAGGDNKARKALREVILDAMAESTTYSISMPSYTYTPADFKPLKWTCTSGTACINGEES